MERKYCLKHDPLTRKILLAMLAPTILMNLTTAIGSMADAVIIGQYLDDLSLSVVTFSMPVYMVINILSALFAVGGCIAMSIDSGKGNKEAANKAFSISVELMVAAGAILLLAGLFFSETIAGWLGAGEEVFDQVHTYSRIILVGAPLFVLNTGIAFFVRNDGRPTLSMVGMFVSIIADIILNFVFVGYLDMGVAGAAYSTVLGRIISILVLGVHFFSKKNTLRFRFAFDRTAVRIIRNGASTALNFVYQFVIILIMNHLLAKLGGTEGVIIYTVVFNLATVALSVFEGISQTVQPMVSTYYGEKSYKNIRETVRLAMWSVVIICGTLTLVLECFPSVIAVIFGIDDLTLIEQAADAVQIYAACMIIMTINVVIGYYLQSIERNSIATVLVSLRCFVVLLAAIVSLGLLYGMNGIWAAYTVTEVLCFAVCLLMLKAARKKLRAEGVETDLLLLDKTIYDSIETYTYCCRENAFAAYQAEVLCRLRENPAISPRIYDDAAEYLACLERCVTAKGRHYVEVEINRREQQVLIRDDLDHSAIKESLQKYVEDASYSLVLGFHRLYLK